LQEFQEKNNYHFQPSSKHFTPKGILSPVSARRGTRPDWSAKNIGDCSVRYQEQYFNCSLVETFDRQDADNYIVANQKYEPMFRIARE